MTIAKPPQNRAATTKDAVTLTVQRHALPDVAAMLRSAKGEMSEMASLMQSVAPFSQRLIAALEINEETKG